MGSKEIQGKLWSKQPADWANIQERTALPGYFYALNILKLSATDKLLDVGCGSGMFISMAKATRAEVTAIDASDELIKQAQERNPSVSILGGEMEQLPFDDESFNIVTGFNSFQYAADIKNALAEAKRVLKPGGKLVTMIWGNKAECEAATYLKAVGSLLPPPPLNAPGPFGLSEENRLEKMLVEVGFTIILNNDIDTPWEYADLDMALKGLMSAGPVARAVEHASFELVKQTLTEAVKPYIQADGSVLYQNKMRVVISEKPE